MNKVILLGRLTKNPDIRLSQANNVKVAKFTLAVNRNYVKPGEERQTDFINIVAYSKLAEFAEKYLTSGMQICLCGRLQIRDYTDNNNQTRYITEVISDEIDFGDSDRKKQENSSNENTQNKVQEDTNTDDGDTLVSNDDLPF